MPQNLLIILFHNAIYFSEGSSRYIEVPLHGSIFNKITFCLGEKQAVLVNKECRSWYNRVAEFYYQFGIGEKIIFYGY